MGGTPRARRRAETQIEPLCKRRLAGIAQQRCHSAVQQIQQCVRIANELGREIATGKEAREIYRIGTWYDSVDETLAANGMAPNRNPGVRGVPLRAVA